MEAWERPLLPDEVGHQPPLRICDGFEDQLLGVDGQMVPFEAGSLQVALPARNTKGQQTLSFGVSNVNGIAQRYVDDALEAGAWVFLTYRAYLESDKSAPAERPRTMTLIGGQLERGEAVFEAGYYDLLNAAWPRDRFTAETAPGLKYQ